MKVLDKNWLTDGLIDFEYKKYILLAYLQDVNKNFNDKKIYPFLSDLIEHYSNLIQIKNNKEKTEKGFPKQISEFDFDEFKVKYESIVEDEELINELDSIMDFAIPLMNSHLTEGKELYDFVERQIKLYPIGILSLNPDQGYMFIRNGNNIVNIYEYHITIFGGSHEKYRGIKSNFIKNCRMTLTNTFEKLKMDIINRCGGVPGVFAIESNIRIPMRETLLPISKRMLVGFIGQDLD